MRGATQFDEPGVFMSFEETIPDLTENVASLGFDLNRLVAEKKLFLDHVHISRAEIAETGEYDLDGLFIRIADAIQRVGAQARRARHASRRCSASCRTRRSCAPKSAGCSAGSRTQGVTTVITAERDGPTR